MTFSISVVVDRETRRTGRPGPISVAWHHEHQLQSAKAKLAADPIDRMAQLLVDSRTQALADEAAHVETVNRILEQGFELPPYQASDTPFVAFNPFPKLP